MIAEDIPGTIPGIAPAIKLFMSFLKEMTDCADLQFELERLDF